jgi:ribonuclease R
MIDRELEILREHLKIKKKAVTIKELFSIVSWSPKKKKNNMNIIDKWIENGDLVKLKSGKYNIPENIGYIKGTLDVVKNRFAFVDGEEFSVFVPKSKFNGAFSGDTVLVKITKENEDGKNKEGEVEKVLKRENDKIIGILQRKPNFGFVVPFQNFGKDIFIPKNKMQNAKDGELVLVEITFWGNNDKKPEGKIVDILGDPFDSEVMIEVLLKREGIQEEFPLEVKKEINKLVSTNYEIDENRVDLRDYNIITIDGADAKDLDDAVYVEKNGENYRLIVSIADVSYYVKEGSALDEEAYKRGNSIYLVDRVIPMFPKELSNGLCSLNPYEDKFTFTCDMIIDKKGRVIDHKVYKSVIRSVERMTYRDVNEIYKGNEELSNKYSNIKEMLFLMLELSKILRQVKKSRGAIDFDLPEIKVVLDENKKVDYIKTRERGEAEKVIEDFMIAANETVAEKIFWLEIPSIYRTHDKPDEERLLKLNESLSKFGYNLHNLDELHPGKFQKIIEDSKEKGINMIIHKLILMSLKQARYTKENTGHFGLSSTYYTHFTSPIRRYADLVVHRVLTDTLSKYPSKKRIKYLDNTLDEVGKHISKTERAAMSIEEESIRIKVVEYMKDKIGNEYSAIITGMNKNGIFMETEEYIDCFYNVIQSKSYHEYDEESLTMIDTDNNITYKIGDKLKVMIVRVDMKELEIEVIPIEMIEKNSES